jgi:hypothetical protein
LSDGKEISISQSSSKIEVAPGDLDVILSGGLIVQGKLRDLILLRESVRKDPRFRIVYVCNSSVRLFVVTEDEYALIRKLRESEQ